MTGATYRASGGREVIAVRDDLRDPTPGSDDVLVAVAFAGLNRADVLERQGRYPVAPSAVTIPGIEFSGVVVATGDRVTARTVGDRICGLVSAGAHARFVATNALATIEVPERVSLRDAAAIPEAFITAHDALFARGRLALGERALVHAAGSSVGLAALALAHRAGAVTYGTSRTATKLERARAHGLDVAIALADSWTQTLRAHAGERGIDVVLDFVGAGMLDANLSVLASRGRIVQIGTMGGTTERFALGPLLAKRAELHGTMLRTRSIDEKIALARAFERDLMPLFASGDLRAEIDRTYSLADLAAAHEHMENDASFGKILIEIGGETPG